MWVGGHLLLFTVRRSPAEVVVRCSELTKRTTLPTSFFSFSFGRWARALITFNGRTGTKREYTTKKKEVCFYLIAVLASFFSLSLKAAGVLVITKRPEDSGNFTPCFRDMPQAIRSVAKGKKKKKYQEKCDCNQSLAKVTAVVVIDPRIYLYY